MPVSKPFSLLVIAIAVIVAIIFMTIYVPKFSYSRKGKYAIGMAGRSVMDMWFRYWNLPGILNRISVYKKWPVPYSKYQRDGFYFEYEVVASPHKNISRPGIEYGQEMFQALAKQIDNKQYDALLFKLCFADFGDKSLTSIENAQARLEEMASLARKVHEYAKKKNMKLLLCNALPVLKPGTYGQELRYMFNKWVADYAQKNQDVVEIDLFEILTDENGKLKKEYSVDLEDSDSHPNMKAFKVLDDHLFSRLEKIAG